MKTAIESLKIVLLCIVAAIVYGILHDQVTARVCAEYFAIGHPSAPGMSYNGRLRQSSARHSEGRQS